jgi:hypothetical protein
MTSGHISLSISADFTSSGSGSEKLALIDEKKVVAQTQF